MACCDDTVSPKRQRGECERESTGVARDDVDEKGELFAEGKDVLLTAFMVRQADVFDEQRSRTTPPALVDDLHLAQLRLRRERDLDGVPIVSRR